MDPTIPCPCFSNLSYGKCCLRLHLTEEAPNALALMRSRYAAYALSLVDYIIQTTSPSSPSFSKQLSSWKESILEFSSISSFVGLEILDFARSQDVARVTFVASIVQEGQDVSFTETSYFVCLEGRWLYLTGEMQSGKCLSLIKSGDVTIPLNFNASWA